MVREMLSRMASVEADIHVVARAAEIVVTTMPHLAISFGAFFEGNDEHHQTYGPAEHGARFPVSKEHVG